MIEIATNAGNEIRAATLVKMQEYLLLREQLDQSTIDPRQQLLDDLADFIDHKVGKGMKLYGAWDQCSRSRTT